MHGVIRPISLNVAISNSPLYLPTPKMLHPKFQLRLNEKSFGIPSVAQLESDQTHNWTVILYPYISSDVLTMSPTIM